MILRPKESHQSELLNDRLLDLVIRLASFIRLTPSDGEGERQNKEDESGRFMEIELYSTR